MREINARVALLGAVVVMAGCSFIHPALGVVAFGVFMILIAVIDSPREKRQ